MACTRHDLEFPATCDAVRDALTGLRTGHLDRAIGAPLGGMAELVLAEVLNNVVEHAMAGRGEGRGEGRIKLTLVYDHPVLTFELRDNGAPMPGLTLPRGTAPDVDTNTGNLPEGGFGWHLIRTLTQDLEYRRKNGWNHLRFQLTNELTPEPWLPNSTRFRRNSL